jgi:hypothetical protein
MKLFVVWHIVNNETHVKVCIHVCTGGTGVGNHRSGVHQVSGSHGRRYLYSLPALYQTERRQNVEGSDQSRGTEGVFLTLLKVAFFLKFNHIWGIFKERFRFQDLMSKSKESFEFPELVDDVPGKKTRRGGGEGSPLKGLKQKRNQRDAGSDEDAEQSDTEREDSDNDDGNSGSRNGSPAKRARLIPEKAKASPSPAKKAVASNKVVNFGLKVSTVNCVT